jgi:hypothetical protein
MNVIKLFSLITMLVGFYGCNEKISSELQNGASTTTTGGGSDGSLPTVVPNEYYFKLVDTSPLLLNRAMHRTGPGNFNRECKISQLSTPLTSTQFMTEGNASPAVPWDQRKYDISCFLEAEELGLHFNGFGMKLEVSPNTCEYIAYEPYSFYDRMPGDSSAKITEVICEGVTGVQVEDHLRLNSANYNPVTYDGPTSYEAVGALGAAHSANPADIGRKQIQCKQAVTSSTDATSPTTDTRAVMDIPDDAQEYCAYDYSAEPEVDGVEKGGNCDTGVIQVERITIMKEGSVITSTKKTEKHYCGGKVTNCLKGAVTQTKDLVVGKTRMLYKPAIDVVNSFTQEYSSMHDRDRSTNLELANFRAELGSPLLDYDSIANMSVYGLAWILSPEAKNYNPNVMEFYSANRQYAQTAANIPASATNLERFGKGRKLNPLAAEANVGTSNATRTSPFYTWYCLDAAMDVKAKIRLAVRDWDRTFTKSSAMENISDFRDTAPVQNLVSLMDNPPEMEEIPGDPTNYNYFDDRADWDDMVRLKRDTTTTPTTWYPVNGWFDPRNFTHGRY